MTWGCLYLLKYNSNTLRIVHNIQQAAQIESIDENDLVEFYQSSLKAQYEHIVRTVNLLKAQHKSADLLFVPGYSVDEMRSQVREGFHALCDILKVNLKKESLDSFCKKFLQSPQALLDGTVIHLFYDRAHIAAALEQDTLINIGGKSYTYQEIFRSMIDKIATQPDNYPSCAKEQFYLRFSFMASDLKKRFFDEFNSQMDKQPIAANLEDQKALFCEATKLAQGFNATKIFPRIKNYIPGDEKHNNEQPVDSIQFEFASLKDMKKFVQKIQPLDKKGILFVGDGCSGQPIVQIKADSTVFQKTPQELRQIALLVMESLLMVTRSLMSQRERTMSQILLTRARRTNKNLPPRLGLGPTTFSNLLGKDREMRKPQIVTARSITSNWRSSQL
jgi:hypothetical protein